MKTIYRLQLVLAIFAFLAGNAGAQLSVKEFDFDFESNDSVLNVNYKGNRDQINKLVEYLKTAKTDPGVEIVNIEISGFTTLENTHEGNTQTSQQRSMSLRNLLGNYSDVTDNVITYNADYIDWTWLKDAIDKSDLNYKAQAQEIMSRPRSFMKYNGDYTRDKRIFGLRWLGQGEVWRYMESNLFPEMSKGSIRITTAPKGSAAAYMAANGNTTALTASTRQSSTPSNNPATATNETSAPTQKAEVKETAQSTATVETAESSATMTSTVDVKSTADSRETKITETVTTPTSTTTLTADITTDKNGSSEYVAEGSSLEMPDGPIPTSQLAASLGTKVPSPQTEPKSTAEMASMIEKGEVVTVETVETTESAANPTAETAYDNTQKPKILWSTSKGLVEAKADSRPAATQPDEQTKAAPEQPKPVAAATRPKQQPDNSPRPAAQPAAAASSQSSAPAVVPVAVKASPASDAPATGAPTAKAPNFAPSAPGEPIPTARLRQNIENRGLGLEQADSRIVAEFTETIAETPQPPVGNNKKDKKKADKKDRGIGSAAMLIDGENTIVLDSGDIILDNSNTIVVRPDKLIIRPNTIIIQSDTIVVDSRGENSSPPPGKPTSFFEPDGEFIHKGAIKTNLLGWGMAQLNLAFDIDLAPHWSFSLPVYYSGWNYFRYELKFRTFDIKPEFRYWPSRSNTGFFVGLHPGFTWFNYAFNGDFRYTNARRPAIGGGLSLGCRFPISRNKRWSMECAVSGGVYSVEYRKYNNVPQGEYIGTFNKTYYGIDGAAVSFLYAFRLR